MALRLTGASPCAVGAFAHISSNGFPIRGTHRGAQTSRDRWRSQSATPSSRWESMRIYDGKITWGRAPLGRTAARSGISFGSRDVFRTRTPCLRHPAFKPIEVNDRVDGHYAWLPFSRSMRTCRSLRPRHPLHGIGGPRSVPSRFVDLDLPATPPHKRVSSACYRARLSSYSVFAPEAIVGGRSLGDYFKAGVWHILSGIDHLLFLVSLLLPAVLLPENR